MDVPPEVPILFTRAGRPPGPDPASAVPTRLGGRLPLELATVDDPLGGGARLRLGGPPPCAYASLAC